MVSRSRRLVLIAIAAAAMLLTLACLLAVRTTASAAGPPPCTADGGHHCLALTNGTSQPVVFAIYDSTSGVPQEIGCFLVEPVSEPKPYPDVYLPNGAELVMSVYDGTNQQCAPDDYALAKFAHRVEQSTRYEYISYSLN
jgi:hypothetical protein